ncbi:hypothetical protein PIB30_035733 [Stylosanthes scabra]|uniref:HMA domain-containing protein n=1 Tax=Stylosanthes scabra TaxID=79078 RepID=A0ABU6ZAW2_9FABA|nr:hypothetical protein [Stylosanthes scabra]
MVPSELQMLQKPRVTEVHVRMDCNGCIQKIKKALSGINGIYDLYIDYTQQKITIIGWADPDKILKAIKKTRKIATICHIELPTDESQPPPEEAAEPEPSQSQPTKQSEPEVNSEKAPESAQEEPPPLPEEPMKGAPQTDVTVSSPRPAENPPPRTPDTRGVGEVHVMHQHQPYNYGNRYDFGHNYVGHSDRYRCQNTNSRPMFLAEPPQQHVHVTHSYNAYMPSPYVTEYEYVRSPPRYTHYNRMEYYTRDYNHSCYNGNGNGNITSMFSDENPNSCRIV